MQNTSPYAIAFGACVLAGGCAPEVTTQWHATANVPSLPAGAASDVVVLHELPDGFLLQEGKLDVDPDYPTREQPNRVVGAIAVEGSPEKEVQRATARTAAASHGANALVEEGGGRFLALRLSNAPPNVPSADAILERLRGTNPSFAPASSAISGDLEGGGFDVGFDGRRGYCYWIAFALDQNAHVRGRTRADYGGWSFSSDLKGTLIPMPAALKSSASNERSRWERGSLTPFSCSARDGKITFRFMVDGKGEGRALVQVLAQPIAEREVSEQEGAFATAEQRRKVAAEDEAKVLSVVCAICRPYTSYALDRCVHAHRPAGSMAGGEDCRSGR